MKKAIGVTEFQEWKVLNYAIFEIDNKLYLNILKVANDMEIDTDNYIFCEKTNAFEMDNELINYFKQQDYEKFIEPFDMSIEQNSYLTKEYYENKIKR